MPHRIGIGDYGSSWSAMAFDLPGCAATAATREELLAIAPVVVAEHLDWLEHWRIPASKPDESGITVVDEVRSEGHDASDGEFCFADDLRPTTDTAIEVGLRIMECSRSDLLRAIKGVPEAILDWRPPASAMAQIDEWRPAPLTIREIVRDVAAAESYYRTSLHDGRVVTPEPERDARDPAQQRQRLIEILRSLSAADRSREFAPIREWQDAPERWTTRKVIRRVISHERFHTAEIRQRLSWLLIGVPQFRRE